jgi:hypothetical protein
MTWGALFVVFFVSHQTGDYLFQTDWQARNKHGGLGRSSDARRALMMHTFTYTCAFVPVLIWIGESIGWKALIIAAAIALPHLFQDDGRLLAHYVRRVKGLPYGRTAGRCAAGQRSDLTPSFAPLDLRPFPDRFHIFS